jgi:hypothetical protein
MTNPLPSDDGGARFCYTEGDVSDTGSRSRDGRDRGRSRCPGRHGPSWSAKIGRSEASEPQPAVSTSGVEAARAAQWRPTSHGGRPRTGRLSIVAIGGVAASRTDTNGMVLAQERKSLGHVGLQHGGT